MVPPQGGCLVKIAQRRGCGVLLRQLGSAESQILEGAKRQTVRRKVRDNSFRLFLSFQP
jgi:hypothetical protein